MDDEDDGLGEYTVKKLTWQQLREARKAPSLHSLRDEDESEEAHPQQRMYQHGAPRYAHDKTGMKPGQYVLRSWGAHPEDIRNRGEYDQNSPEVAPYFLGVRGAVPESVGEALEIFRRVTRPNERTKMVMAQQNRPDMRFINSVAGFLRKPPEKLFEVVGDSTHVTAIKFVKSVKKWARDFGGESRYQCYTANDKIGVLKEDEGVGSFDELSDRDTIQTFLRSRQAIVELVNFIRFISGINKSQTLKHFRDDSYSVSAGKIPVNLEIYKDQMVRVARALEPLVTYFDAFEETRMAFPIINNVLKIAAPRNVIEQGSKVRRSLTFSMATLVDLICNGATLTRSTSEPHLISMFGEGVSTELVNEVVRFWEIFMKADNVGIGNLEDFENMVMCYDVEAECDRLMITLERDHIKTYDQFDRVVLGPIITAMAGRVGTSYLSNLYQSLMQSLEKSLDADVVINSEVVSASDCAFHRVLTCCPECRKYITKTGLMHDDSVYIPFAEITAKFIMQTYATKEYQQQSVIEQTQRRIYELETDFANNLTWNKLTSRLEMV